MSVTNQDYYLSLEYKYLLKHFPDGVVLLPQVDDNRKLHGVIFVHQGPYAGGIFRFTVTLPPEYNSKNSFPLIVFTPPIFHPLISPETGELDFRIHSSYQQWIPERHVLVTIAIFVKKVLRLTGMNDFIHFPNPVANDLYNNNQDAFHSKAREAVSESLKRLYDPQPPGCSIVFSDHKPAHDIMRDKIFSKYFPERYNSPMKSPRKNDVSSELMSTDDVTSSSNVSKTLFK